MIQILHYLIIYCSNRAVKYDNMLKMLKEYNLEEPKFKYIYSIGLITIKRDVWLDRICRIQSLIRKL